MFKGFRSLLAMVACATLTVLAVPAAAHTQCAPYARAVSGIALHGAAAGWWGEAEGRYERGQAPKEGAVLAFRATRSMRSGHVATVAKVMDERHVLLNHANWSRPGMIERSAMAEDISPNGDWTQVRVYYAPIHGLGLRASPAFGFIYAKGTAVAQVSRRNARA
ncbi:CHAP domain-containing protein [Novosphingobium umbonatum]|uniref:CHAP domain-containing protein n=1 Tax=Novosphingobium umbonatum TaxID=1908524 RepID=A0A437N4W9_9SPHN|nr:CHAP domain-containing protein [Novosphingobium umbonatum]RVU04960.1 CHAP domain-containing protein [Novosphingobium umbonatum]